MIEARSDSKVPSRSRSLAFGEGLAYRNTSIRRPNDDAEWSAAKRVPKERKAIAKQRILILLVCRASSSAIAFRKLEPDRLKGGQAN